jgi:hypothetical protein
MVAKVPAARARSLDDPGGHASDYWNAHWRGYMRFYARALSACRR